MNTCNKCGAEKVLNPKTNKWFCKDKCWLKEADEFGSYNAPRQEIKNEALEVLKEIRDLVQLIYDKEK